MPSGRTEWKRVPVPKDLMDVVDKICRQSGYTSGAEFVRDAVRRRIKEIEKGD